MTPEVVAPASLEANGLQNPFTGRKKWRIECGKCGHTWDEKVPIQGMCSAVCPCCHSQNKWDAEKFERWYYEQISH